MEKMSIAKEILNLLDLRRKAITGNFSCFFCIKNTKIPLCNGFRLLRWTKWSYLYSLLVCNENVLLIKSYAKAFENYHTLNGEGVILNAHNNNKYSALSAPTKPTNDW